jgi:hypothetical protein
VTRFDYVDTRFPNRSLTGDFLDNY